MSAPRLELMDLRVKQRLVGASILLVLVVLIVPELLSGPKPAAPLVFPDPASAPPATRTITVPVNALADGTLAVEPTAPPSAPPVMPPSTPPVMPPRASPSASPTASPGESASGRPVAAPAPSGDSREMAAMPLENAPKAPKSEVSTQVSPTGAWSVQLGSFASKPNAEKLVHEVGAKGYTPYVSPIGSGTTLRFRVRVGPFAERAAAQRELEKLKSQGLAATLEPPPRP